MGRPLQKTDIDEIGMHIHRRNVTCSRKLLDLLSANHGIPSNDNPPPPHVNLEPGWWHSMWFGDLITAQGPNHAPRIAFIQIAVAKSFNVTPVDILSRKRTDKVVLPRQVAMYLSKSMTSHSYPEIGRRFGGRDHTTVIHAVQKIRACCVSDPEFAGRINALQAEISA